MTFLPPSNPTVQAYLPQGPQWSFEVKFDGYRAQVHAGREGVAVYSRNGHDWSSRFPTIVAAARAFPVRSAILDGEIVVDGDGGKPDFIALHRRRPGAHALWSFDLLALNGRDLRRLPYYDRRERLEGLIGPGGIIRVSERFSDGDALLKACAEHGLEGVVAKKIDAPYRSGKTSAWVKVKCQSWIELNRERHRLFDKV